MPGKIHMMQILAELMSEVGDLQKLPAYKYEKLSDEFAEFTTDSGTQISMEMERDISMEEMTEWLDEGSIPEVFFQTYARTKKSKDICNLNFTAEGDFLQGKKTDLAEYARIMKTVVEFTNEYIEKHKPFAVQVFADELPGKSTKTEYYGRILKQNLRSDYRLIENVYTVDGYKGFIIMRMS